MGLAPNRPTRNDGGCCVKSAREGKALLLSRTYAPSPTLAPFVRRHYVFHADLPQDFELVDRLLSETAFIRILLEGDWRAETAPGEWHGAGPVPLFGPNARPLTVKVRGAFVVIGIAIRPGGWGALFADSARDHADHMVSLHDLWGDLATQLHESVDAARDDAAIVAAIEAVLARRLAQIGVGTADPIAEAFEAIARFDSTIRVADAAAQIGVSVPRLERVCYARFGHSPKAILRRSRFLDMAAAFRGFSDPSAEDLAALRYFDSSHRNREFRRFIGMTPGAFAKTPTPLLTAGLKLRVEGMN